VEVLTNREILLKLLQRKTFHFDSASTQTTVLHNYRRRYVRPPICPSTTRWNCVQTIVDRNKKSAPTDSPSSTPLRLSAYKVQPEIQKGSPRARTLNERQEKCDFRPLRRQSPSQAAR